MFTINEIIQALTGQQTPQYEKVFCEAAVDSRQIIPGSLFVAIAGERVDGHRFVAQAFDKGAGAALIQTDALEGFSCIDLRNTVPADDKLPNFPCCIRVDNTVEALQKIAGAHRDNLNIKTIGITGTVGKSTTKELTAEVISSCYHTIKNIGNQNNEIGLPLTILRAGYGHERAILEMGFYVRGEIDFLCSIAKPEIGVVTNVGTVHAERAGTKEDIAEGKSELVKALPANGFAVLNYDDPYVRPMADLTAAQVYYYGLDPRADFWADEIVGKGLEGIEFTLHNKSDSIHVCLPSIGRHSVYTALRAAATGRADGMEWDEILDGFGHAQSQLRMSTIRSANGALIIDDTYNASPDSTLAALDLLDDMNGYKLAVLGEMRELGIYEKDGHTKVGIRAAEVCDELIAVGEVTKIMAEGALSAGLPADKITWLETVPEAIDFLRERGTDANEVILIKGSRGMAMERIVDSMEDKNG